MARIIANIIIYLCLACSIISANEDNDNIVENVRSETVYKTPEVPLVETSYLVETFNDEEKFKNRWVLSEAKKDSIDEDIAKYDGLHPIIWLIYLYV